MTDLNIALRPDVLSRNRAIAPTITVAEESIRSTISQLMAAQPLASSENQKGLRILHHRRKQMLKKNVIRGGKNQVVGSVITWDREFHKTTQKPCAGGRRPPNKAM
jgi:hypothetical protein